jgi:hypothetical protein
MNLDEDNGGVFVQENPSNDLHQHDIYTFWLQNKENNFR